MNKYYIPLEQSLRVKVIELHELITATNRRYEVGEDPRNENIIVFCENKPDDLPEKGIVWKEQVYA